MSNVTVLGLGTMGGRIARTLAAAGHQVAGFDPVPGARDAAAEAGIGVFAAASQALADAELVVLSMPRPEHVLEAAQGPLQDATGAVVADLSTIDPASARRVSRILADREVSYLDAPVLGRPDRIGNWTLPVGGDEAACALAASVLEGTVASRVVRVGDVGAGSTIKVLNNLMFGAINAITAEALAACEAAGVDPMVFTRTVADSGAATVSNLFQEVAPKMVAGDYEPVFALALLAKDTRLALQLVEEAGAHAPMAAVIDQVNSEAIELGYAESDTGAVLELYRARARRT
jgi:3-hydroxyisobutyrate dehydrogenase